MKPYAQYQASGVDWLGEVPGHWEVKRIKYLITTIEQGWSPQCEGFPAQSEDEWAVLKVGCVNGGVFQPEENKQLPTEFDPIPELGLSVGDLLISRANTRELVGSAAVTLKNYPKLMLCDKLYRLRVDHSAYSPSFIAFFLGTTGARGQIELAATGSSSSMLNIGQSTILHMQIAMPPLAEQQAIAAYLDTETARLDTLVREKEELVALLREARGSRISERISGDDLPGKPTGDPWAPHLPDGWEFKRLKHLAQVRSGLAKGKDAGDRQTVELPYLRVANVQEGRLDLREIATMPVELDAVERFSLVAGDVLMNEGGDYDKVGRGAVWTGEITPCLHQNHVFAVRPQQRDLSEWLAAITQTQYAKFYFMNNAKQSTNLASISQTSVRELPVLLPPKAQRDALLQGLSAELTAFDALITHTQEEITLLKELRSATIADAVLGRVDVCTAKQK
ncbi:MAG: restriction endonuclease subunit S [Proteobacteria bacterium]|nr:restriction endonuclease subunit S [Pseudomonadota bacterium]MBS0493467.1 restriction endonuclease subunit S [Pseudomonadota bacterium]